jgi:hypothetical protein
MTEEFSPGISDPGGGGEWEELGGLDDPSAAGTAHACLVERVVWVVTIELKLKSDPSTTTTYYLSRQYYDAGALYTSSPVIYPLLAGEPDDLILDRGVGREIAVLYEPEVSLYGKMCLDDYGKSFFDLAELYELHGAIVTFGALTSAYGELATASAANVMQDKMEVRNFQWEGDILSLGCKQVLFKDKEISKKLTLETFPNMVEEYDQEYGAIVFGQNVIVSVPFVETGTARQSDIFLSWVATGHELNAFNQLYARNTESPADAEWVPIEIDSNADDTHGNPYFVGFGDSEAAVGDAWCIVFSPGPGANKILFGVELAVFRTGSEPTSGQGAIKVTISRAPDFSSAGVYIDDRPLREAYFDFPATASLINLFAYCYPPLVTTENENYLIQAEWTEPLATNYYSIFLETTAATNTNDNAQSRDNTVRGAGWVNEASTDPGIAIYSFQSRSGGFDSTEGTTPSLYSRYRFGCTTKHVAPSSYTPNSDGKMHYGVEIKADISGIEDDSSGTYTGSANAVIEYAADIIKFLLLDDELGINHGSGNIDSASFTAARTAQAAAGLAMSFALEGQTFVSNIILTLLRHSRSCLWLKRDGDLALEYHTYSDTPTFRATQGQWEHEMDVLSVVDSADDDIVNDIEIPFAVNKLNQIRDRDIIRRLGGSQYQGLTYLNGDDSSDDDTSRQLLAARSITKYGRRSVREAFETYGATSTGPTAIRNYWLDRYREKQRTVVVRLPFVEFSTAELFDTLKVSHCKLPAKNGTAHRVRWHEAGDEVPWYNNGIPVTWRSYGSIAGVVTNTRMQGDDIVITIETMSPF